MRGVDNRIKLYVVTSLHGERLYVAERLRVAVKISCMVEQTIIMGGDLLGYGRKIMAW